MLIAVGWVGSGSVKSGYGSEDPDTKPYKNLKDPEHWLTQVRNTDPFEYAAYILNVNSNN